MNFLIFVARSSNVIVNGILGEEILKIKNKNTYILKVFKDILSRITC